MIGSLPCSTYVPPTFLVKSNTQSIGKRWKGRISLPYFKWALTRLVLTNFERWLLFFAYKETNKWYTLRKLWLGPCLVAHMWRPPSWLKAIPRASESSGKAGFCYHISNGHLRPSSLPTSKGDCCFLPIVYFLWEKIWLDYGRLYWFESYDFRDFTDFEIPDFLFRNFKKRKKHPFILMPLYYCRNQKNTKEKYDQFAFRTRAVNLSCRGGGRAKNLGGTAHY